MRASGFLLLVLFPAFSQTIVPPETGMEFLNGRVPAPLKCQLQPIHPTLDFAFRFHSGVSFRVPFNQYRGGGHVWTVGMRIQAENGGSAVYTLDRMALPEGTKNVADALGQSEFLLGEGNYRASFLLMDDEGRGCRGDWTLAAHQDSAEHPVKLTIAPGAVEPLNGAVPLPRHAEGAPSVDKLTVLLHAAPVTPSMSQLHAGDTATLLASLVALLNQVTARTVKLVVFNLDQQKELYRRDGFTLDQLADVHKAISTLQLDVVRYGALQKPAGYLDMLAHLVQAETTGENPAQMVVFLGAHSRLTGKVLADELPQTPTPTRFLYLQYMRPIALDLDDPTVEAWLDATSRIATQLEMDPFDGESAELESISLPALRHPTQLDLCRDSIDLLMGALKGKTLPIRKPADLAKAMQQIVPAPAK